MISQQRRSGNLHPLTQERAGLLVEILLMLSGCASPPPVRPEVAAWQRMESERAELRVAERGLMLDDLEALLGFGLEETPAH